MLRGDERPLLRPWTKILRTNDFWLPAACGGAALGANITVVVVVVLVMSFTQICFLGVEYL